MAARHMAPVLLDYAADLNAMLPGSALSHPSIVGKENAMSSTPIALAPLSFRALQKNLVLPQAGGQRSRARRDAPFTAPDFRAPFAEASLQEIVVPLDGSPHAEHALPWAIHLAALAGARLRLIHVHLKLNPAFRGRRLELYQDFDRLTRQPMEEYIADVTRRIKRVSAIPVSPMVVDGRHIASTLADFAAAAQDLVVMATRGRTTVGRMLFGSPLDAVVHRLRAPLLHVRGYSCPVDLTARPSFEHALVPLDDSRENHRVLGPVAMIGKLTDGRQTLLHVVRPEGKIPRVARSASDELNRHPVARLEAMATSWRDELPRARASVVWSDLSPAREILAQAKERDADFIAISTRARGQMRRLFQPAVFDYLVRESRIPVFVVRAPSE